MSHCYEDVHVMSVLQLMGVWCLVACIYPVTHGSSIWDMCLLLSIVVCTTFKSRSMLCCSLLSLFEYLLLMTRLTTNYTCVSIVVCYSGCADKWRMLIFLLSWSQLHHLPLAQMMRYCHTVNGYPLGKAIYILTLINLRTIPPTRLPWIS